MDQSWPTKLLLPAMTQFALLSSDEAVMTISCGGGRRGRRM
jgi:hypothetical protein